jgi:hypothetical protein
VSIRDRCAVLKQRKSNECPDIQSKQSAAGQECDGLPDGIAPAGDGDERQATEVGGDKLGTTGVGGYSDTPGIGSDCAMSWANQGSAELDLEVKPAEQTGKLLLSLQLGILVDTSHLGCAS